MKDFDPSGIPRPINEKDVNYRTARRDFFVGIALKYPHAWDMHRDMTQLERPRPGELNFQPAVRHCMVEAARAEVFADLLNLSRGMSAAVVEAALLHDSYKKGEVLLMRQDPSWENYDLAQQQARQVWEGSRRFSPLVMDIAGSVAHETIGAMETILAKNDSDLSEEDVARLVMHYIDDYTFEDEWAKEAELNGLEKQNDLARRMRKNETNPRYQRLNETGRVHFNGQTTYQAQLQTGKRVEARIARLIEQRRGLVIDPSDLPVVVDNIIKKKLLGRAALLAAA